MKDLIEISVNGKVVASHEMYLEGASPLQKIERVKRFHVVLSEYDVIVETIFGLIREDDIVCEVKKPVAEEKKMPASIEAMATPIQERDKLLTTLANSYNEIPIKTRKPRGPNKPKEEAPEKSVFDKPVEDVVAPVVEPVVEKPIVEVKKAPAVSTPTTPVRINELGKLIKMWCKASALKIETITIDILKAQAFDIVENDSDETIIAGIEEAKRLMQG